MKRQAIVLLTMTWLILGMISAGAPRAAGVSSPATLKGVTVSDPSAGRELLLRIEGGYSYQITQATDETLFVDLKGAKVGGMAKTAQWSGGLLTSYRLLSYRDAEGKPAVRVQIEARHHEPVAIQRDPQGLRLVFGEGSALTAASAVAPAASPAAPPVAPATTPQLAPSNAASGGPVEVSNIAIKAEADGETFVDVTTSRNAAFRVLELKNPARLAVDLEGARKATRQKSYATSSPLLKSVRVGQFQEKNPAVVRVVADLTGDPAFDVYPIDSGLRIDLKPHNLAKAPVATAVPAPEPAPKPEEQKPVQVATGAPALEAPAAPLSTDPSPSAVPEPAPTTASAAVPASTSTPAPMPAQVKAAPADFQSTLPAAESSQAVAAPRPATLTQGPEALQAEKAARTLAAQEAVPAAPPPPPQAQPAAAPPSGTPASEEKPKYTGEPISLNLKDVDLKDFFRLVHEISGLNIIVDPNVAGNVTMVLDSVPWDQALDIVLKNNRLGKTLEGNVLRIARLDTLTAEQEESSKLAAAREEAAPLVTIFRPVNYAKAATIATLLKSWAGGGALTKRGTTLVDERTNTLIISDIQSQIPIIENIISKLDRKAKQVAIEARIVLATAAFTRDLQSALSGGWVNRSGSTVVGGSTGTGASVTPNVSKQSILIGQTSALGYGAFAVANASSRYIINAAIAAAETRSQAKTISRPTIVTQNNVMGTVTQGSQIPIQTTINNTISITYVNATLTLSVTPQVTDDGNIFMIINVQNASPGPSLTAAGPSINTQAANTQVLVPDGGTVVFGGVTVTSRTKSATYVPLVGSIPILGHLFKTSNVRDNDQELLFFVSPKVLAG